MCLIQGDRGHPGQTGPSGERGSIGGMGLPGKQGDQGPKGQPVSIDMDDYQEKKDIFIFTLLLFIGRLREPGFSRGVWSFWAQGTYCLDLETMCVTER